jgi:hypothetical protein
MARPIPIIQLCVNSARAIGNAANEYPTRRRKVISNQSKQGSFPGRGPVAGVICALTRFREFLFCSRVYPRSVRVSAGLFPGYLPAVYFPNALPFILSRLFFSTRASIFRCYD